MPHRRGTSDHPEWALRGVVGETCDYRFWKTTRQRSMQQALVYANGALELDSGPQLCINFDPIGAQRHHEGIKDGSNFASNRTRLIIEPGCNPPVARVPTWRWRQLEPPSRPLPTIWSS
jgi:hypothetical protein